MCVYFLPCILHTMLTVSHLHQVSSSVQVTRTPTSQTCSFTEGVTHTNENKKRKQVHAETRPHTCATQP